MLVCCGAHPDDSTLDIGLKPGSRGKIYLLILLDAVGYSTTFGSND
jgi:hypothetical protein